MFTVKVREERIVAKGSAGLAAALPEVTETMFEAKQVRFAEGQVVCDVEDGQIVYQQRSVASDDDRQTLYVMNRFGATVATYHL